MNMDLKWEKQIAKLGSMVGRYRHIAEKNNLSPAQTTTLFNIYLKNEAGIPDAVYRHSQRET